MYGLCERVHLVIGHASVSSLYTVVSDALWNIKHDAEKTEVIHVCQRSRWWSKNIKSPYRCTITYFTPINPFHPFLLHLQECLLKVHQKASMDSLYLSGPFHSRSPPTLIKITPQGILFIPATVFTENTQRTSWASDGSHRMVEGEESLYCFGQSPGI